MGCSLEVHSGIWWPQTLRDFIVTRPCNNASSRFRTGPMASRKCSNEGEWEEADLTPCTIRNVEDPFLLVWFVIDAEKHTDDQEQDFVENVGLH